MACFKAVPPGKICFPQLYESLCGFVLFVCFSKNKDHTLGGNVLYLKWSPVFFGGKKVSSSGWKCTSWRFRLNSLTNLLEDEWVCVLMGTKEKLQPNLPLIYLRIMYIWACLEVWCDGSENSLFWEREQDILCKENKSRESSYFDLVELIEMFHLLKTEDNFGVCLWDCFLPMYTVLKVLFH